MIALTIGDVSTPGSALMTTLADEADVHPKLSVTINVYVPGSSTDIIVLVPLPVEVTPPGVRVNVHEPTPGKLFIVTLPVANAHVGCVIAPNVGVAGTAFTVNVNVAATAAQGVPKGLSVVMVITIDLPASVAAGV